MEDESKPSRQQHCWYCPEYWKEFLRSEVICCYTDCSERLSINEGWKNRNSVHRINLNEREKKDKYLDLARELKNLWNMKVTIVPIVIGALGTITKGLLKGLEDLEIGGWTETIQTTVLLRMARILRRVLETWQDLLSLRLQWKTIS